MRHTIPTLGLGLFLGVYACLSLGTAKPSTTLDVAVLEMPPRRMVMENEWLPLGPFGNSAAAGWYPLAVSIDHIDSFGEGELTNFGTGPERTTLLYTGQRWQGAHILRGGFDKLASDLRDAGVEFVDKRR